jgi:hypothetical protein
MLNEKSRPSVAAVMEVWNCAESFSEDNRFPAAIQIGLRRRWRIAIVVSFPVAILKEESCSSEWVRVVQVSTERSPEAVLFLHVARKRTNNNQL